MFDKEPAAHRPREMADQIFHQTGHHLEIREGPVGLEHGEFRIMPARNSFIAKVAVQFEDLRESRDEQPFEVEFRGDAKIQVHPERIVMRLEGLRGRAAGNRLHHGRFDFNKAPFVQEPPDLANDGDALAEYLARFRIGNQIEVALPVFRLGVLHAMPFLGQRAQGLRKNGKSFHADCWLTGLRDEALALHSDPVTDV